MAQLLVNKKLNRRSKIPAVLPDNNGIVDTVPKGHIFFGTLVDKKNFPNPSPQPPLDKWYVDSSGFFYWAGALTEVPQVESKPVMLPGPVGSFSAEQIKHGTGATPGNAQKFASFINEACARFNIDTPVRQLSFLAQVGHESMGLLFTEEIASGEKYENRLDLGNIHPGDGVRFKGRGLIQITGRANYGEISKDLGFDFVQNPILLGGKKVDKCSNEQLKNAALSAAWFWNKRRLNDLADKIDLDSPIDKAANDIHFRAITKKINGGLNGLADRVSRYKSGVNFFR